MATIGWDDVAKGNNLMWRAPRNIPTAPTTPISMVEERLITDMAVKVRSTLSRSRPTPLEKTWCSRSSAWCWCSQAPCWRHAASTESTVCNESAPPCGAPDS